jgi:NADP-dependent 3-hydroxy acid dehydrogenase YdfG
VRDALSGTPKVAIVTGASSGIGHIQSSHNAVQHGLAKAKPVRKLHLAQEKREECGFF